MKTVLEFIILGSNRELKIQVTARYNGIFPRCPLVLSLICLHKHIPGPVPIHLLKVRLVMISLCKTMTHKQV